MTEIPHIARNTIKARTMCGLDRAAMADLAGISWGTLRALERGDRNGKVALVQKIASFFCIPLETMLAEGEIKVPDRRRLEILDMLATRAETKTNAREL